MTLFSGGIGFFDSGIGGLTVLQTCLESLNNQTVYYYGDNQRAPYGNLPKEQIQEYVDQAFEVFSRLRVKAAVIACNTVTALCIDSLRDKYDFPIIGAEPAIFPAAKRGGEILVLCTKRTSESERVQILKQKAEKRYPNAHITLSPCEGLAGVIEQSPFSLTKNVSAHLPPHKADVVVCGCTHYIYYKEYIEKFYNCPVFDGNQGIKRQLLRAIDHSFTKNRDNRPLGFDFSKNRDDQPLEDDLFDNADILDPEPIYFPSEDTLQGNKAPFNAEKEGNSLKNPYKNKLFFSGSGQRNNKKLCEQMFAREKSLSGGAKVVKAPKKLKKI